MLIVWGIILPQYTRKRFPLMTDTAAPPKPKRQGNYKAGPGRPPGSKNKKTLALEEAARQAAAKIKESGTAPLRARIPTSFSTAP